MDLGGPLDALSFSPDFKFIAVGGREVFKILTIENDVFQERINLKRGKHNVLNKTVVDVKWHLKRNNTIASAPTSGTVIVWDLLDAQGTMVKVYSEHSRTVNKLSWKPSDEHLILSASQDGLVKLWDIRTDLSSSTFEIKSEVRNVKWSPFYPNLFATGTENGSIDIWDVRIPEKPFRSVRSAHIGVIHSLDWHPKSPNTIASGSRDLMVKVFDLSIGEDTPRVVIQTIGSVSCCVWRPGQQNHIASSANVMDYDAHIWDTTQPFIPRYSIESHQDVITDMQWYKNEGEVLLTCSKDSFVKMHKVSEAKKPFETSNSSCLSWSPKDRLLFTPCIDKSEKKAILLTSPQKCHVEAPEKHGDIQILEETTSSNLKTIRHFAKYFKVFGEESIEEKCLHNAKEAEKYSLEDIKLTWLILSTLDLPDIEVETQSDSKSESVSPRSTESPLIGRKDHKEKITSPKFDFIVTEDPLDLCPILEDTLEYYADVSNVQMCFAISWIFQNKSIIASSKLIEWQHEYLTLLNKMREFVFAAEIRKHTYKSTKHTPLVTCCGNCGKFLNCGKCLNCNSDTHICVICRLPCKGSYLWLSKCGHGGHVDHMKQWFRSNPFCPACSLPMNKCFV